MHVLQMWETSVRYFQKSIRIIRPIRGREKEYEHQWFNLTTDIADLADKILTKEKTTALSCLQHPHSPSPAFGTLSPRGEGVVSAKPQGDRPFKLRTFGARQTLGISGV